jgi:hypothetical protein
MLRYAAAQLAGEYPALGTSEIVHTRSRRQVIWMSLPVDHLGIQAYATPMHNNAVIVQVMSGSGLVQPGLRMSRTSPTLDPDDGWLPVRKPIYIADSEDLERKNTGHYGHVSVMREPNAELRARIVETLTHVIDECFAIAPQYHRVPGVLDDPEWRVTCAEANPHGSASQIDGCIADERAARELDAMRPFHSDMIGPPLQRPCALSNDFDRLAALHDKALAFFVRLAHSENASARLAAVAGLAQLHGRAAQEELKRLTGDEATSEPLFRCSEETEKVGEAARRALQHAKPLH